MSDFLTALTKELRAFQDETTWLFPATVREMLTNAAAAALLDPLPRITLRREVEPDDLTVYTVLDLGEGDTFTLDAGDVATLRALLLAWDENRPAQVGDPLSMPCKLADGRVVPEVVPEMLPEAMK